MVCILYCRVSTAEQTLEHQVTLARNGGFEIDEVVSDHGVSGVSVPLAERPQGKRLFDMLRAGDVLVVHNPVTQGLELAGFARLIACEKLGQHQPPPWRIGVIAARRRLAP